MIIGSRGSKLALMYAEKAKEFLLKSNNISSDDIEIKKIITKGDQVKDQRLSEVGGKDYFPKILNKNFRKKIDIAVHALKDMPAIETDGLQTNCFLKRNDPREVIISRDGKNIKEIKTGALIVLLHLEESFKLIN